MLPNFIWGESWSYTFHLNNALYYIPNGNWANFISVDGVQNAVGNMYDLYESKLGPIFTNGIPYDNLTYFPLGQIEVNISGAIDNESMDWYDTVPGSLYRRNSNVYCRIFYGESDSLPTHVNDLTASVNNMLITSSRNVMLQFSESVTPKYKIIALPNVLIQDDPSNTAPYAFNSIRTLTDTIPSFVTGTFTSSTDPIGYLGYPYTTNSIAYGPFSPYNHYNIFVIQPSTESMSIVLRQRQSTSSIYYGDSTDPNWQTINAFNKCSERQLLSVRIETISTYYGGSLAENTGAMATSASRNIEVYYTHSVGLFEQTHKHTISSGLISLSGFDGLLDGLGTSGHKTVERILTGSSVATYTSGSIFDQFTGSGTINLITTVSKSLSVTGSNTIYHMAVDSTASGYILIRYVYYVD